MEQAGRAVSDPLFDPHPAWHSHVDEILSALATTMRPNAKMKPVGLSYVEKCCMITEVMKANSMLTPLLGHDIFQMPFLYRDTEPKDWFPAIYTRQDGNDWKICDTLVISMYGDSTFRWTRPDGTRDKAHKKKVVNAMMAKASGGAVEATEVNLSGTGMSARSGELQRYEAKNIYSNGKGRTALDKDVLIFTCNCNELCHGTGFKEWQIDGMGK